MSKKSRAAILSNLERVLEPPPKRRRAEHLDGLLDEYGPAEPPAPQPPDNRLPVNQDPVQSSPPDVQQVVETPPVQSPASTPPQVEPLLPESHSLTIDHLLPPNAPHLRTPYVTIERFRQLSPGPRAVCEEIYRAAAGWHSDECVISVSKLALYCNIDEKYVRKYLAQLQSLGYVERLGIVQGGADLTARGIRFRVLLPRLSPPDKKTPVRLSGGDNRPPNKESIKANNLKGVDASACPDCHGTGFWYPEGQDKGVARCLHEKLSQVRAGD